MRTPYDAIVEGLTLAIIAPSEAHSQQALDVVQEIIAGAIDAGTLTQEDAQRAKLEAETILGTYEESN